MTEEVGKKVCEGTVADLMKDKTEKQTVITLTRKNVPERSEDDFFPANQPDRAALHSQWQRAIFAVRNEIMVENYIANLFCSTFISLAMVEFIILA